MQSKLGSLVAFIKIAIAVIFSVYRNGGGHRTENMTFCEIIVWLFTSYETPFIHISWYPYLDIYVESIIQMDRKRMTSIWALFRISLLPFTYLRTKNPGSKKCIERSQEGRISLSWGRGQKENDVFHRAETLKRKINYIFHRAATLKEKYKYVFDRSVTLKDTHIEANTNYCWCVQRCLLILGWGEREVGESFSCFERIRRTRWPESPLSNKSRGLGGVKSFY